MNTSQILRRLLVALASAGIVVACAQGPIERAAEGTSSARQTAGDKPKDPTEPACSPKQGEEACALCCAGDGPARPVFEAANKCFSGCGEKDEACWDGCYGAFEKACEAVGDACWTAVSCLEDSCESCENKEPKEPNKKTLVSVQSGKDKPNKPNKPECGKGDDDDDDNKGDDDDDDDDKK